MNKPPVSRTLQYLFLIILLSTLATATIINSSQYRSTSTAITPASATINNTNFSTTSAFEFVGGTANSSQYSTILGIKPTLPACGNNILELGESCDGTSLNNQTCISQGYTSGTLTCKPDCSGFDTNSCILLRPRGPSGPIAAIIEGGGERAEREKTTTTTSTTTTTTIQKPQPELPAKIPEKVAQALKRAAKQLSALETETGKLYNAILLIVITLAGYLSYLILKYFRKRIWPRILQQRAAQQQQQQAQQQQQQQQQELKNYLKQNLEQGHQPSFIISTLLQHGWQKEEIQQALEQVLKELKT